MLYFRSRRRDSSFPIFFIFCWQLAISHGRVEAFGRLTAKDRNDVKFWLVGCVFLLLLSLLCFFFRARRLQLSEPRIEYHQFERVKCGMESGKTEFLCSIDFKNSFLFSLGFSCAFQISSLFLRLVYTYDASTSASHAFLFFFACIVFTTGLCLCLCLCLRRTCKPAFFPSFYVLDFSLELENEWKEILRCCRVPFTRSLVSVGSLVCKKKEKSDLRGPAGPLVWRY